MSDRRVFLRVALVCSAVSLWALSSGGCAGTTDTDPDPVDTATSTGSQGGGGSTTTAGGNGSGGNPGPCGTDCSLINTPQCQVAQCNVQTGQCEVVNDEEGVACDDGMFCTISDSCSMGTCVGGAQNDCGMSPPQCTEVTCDEMSQTCSSAPAQNGAACQDPNDLCLKGSTCSNGLCIGGSQEDCFFFPVPSDCHVAECNTGTGMCEPVPGNFNQPCIDQNDLCTINKTCDTTAMCTGGVAKDCTYLTVGCDLGVCDTVNGMCGAMAVMNGQACDDLNGCTVGEICTSQTCGGGTAVTNCSLTGDGCCPNNCTANNDLDCQIQPSCKDFKMASPGSVDGFYTIDPDGPGPGMPFQVWCDMAINGGGWTECASVLNTIAEELNCTTDKAWLDDCVDFTMANWSGSEVMVQAVQGSTKMYSGYGVRTNTWTYNNLTSSGAVSSQYNRLSQHTNTITLNTGHLLSISGKDGANGGWGGDWGNGYMPVVATSGCYACNVVLSAFSFQRSGTYQPCTGRSFQGITAGHEVMFDVNGGITTNGNAALTTQQRFLGQFKFFVR